MGGGTSKGKAVATFAGAVTGSVEFTAVPGGTRVRGTLAGLAPGQHGFHIHEYGDLRGACAAAGAHWDPHRKGHGARTGGERHLGDLGNLEADALGRARVEFVHPDLPLRGRRSVVGRSLVVHAGADDLGTGKGQQQRESRASGNSGRRVGCAVIGLASDA